MKMSDSINEIATVYSKMQSEIRDAIKDNEVIVKTKSGGTYKYDYADLACVLNIAREYLPKNDLSFAQFPSKSINKNEIIIETIIMHKSGQYFLFKYSMPIQYSDKMSMAQSVGCIITYARRYALSAAIGITQTDTDGRSEIKDNIDIIISRHEAYLLKEKIKKAASNTNDICKFYKINSIETMNYSQFTDCMYKLQNKIDKNSIENNNELLENLENEQQLEDQDNLYIAE